MTAIIDYGAGNIKSVTAALERIGTEYLLTSDPSVIKDAHKVILPGVGNDAEAISTLRERGLTEVIRSRRKPVLGICVGMQVMCNRSEEGDCECMGIFDTDVRRFVPTPDAKVPHMGWNRIHNPEGKLFKGMEGGEYLYFVHSYYAMTCSDTIATCNHAGVTFSAALKYENFYGTQFHPEKSGSAGELILRNFLEL